MAIFASRIKNLKIVYKHIHQKVYDNGLRETKPGENIEFKNGKYETKDKDIINFLRNHKSIHLYFYEISGPDDIKSGDSEKVVQRKKLNQDKIAAKIKKSRIKLAETDESSLEEYEVINL